MQQGLLNEKQACKMLGVSAATMQNWRCLNKGPAFTKLGDSIRSPVRYTLEAVEEFFGGKLTVPQPKRYAKKRGKQRRRGVSPNGEVVRYGKVDHDQPAEAAQDNEPARVVEVTPPKPGVPDESSPLTVDARQLAAVIHKLLNQLVEMKQPVTLDRLVELISD
jgi:hypothetical protein